MKDGTSIQDIARDSEARPDEERDDGTLPVHAGDYLDGMIERAQRFIAEKLESRTSEVLLRSCAEACFPAFRRRVRALAKERRIHVTLAPRRRPRAGWIIALDADDAIKLLQTRRVSHLSLPLIAPNETASDTHRLIRWIAAEVPIRLHLPIIEIRASNSRARRRMKEWIASAIHAPAAGRRVREATRLGVLELYASSIDVANAEGEAAKIEIARKITQISRNPISEIWQNDQPPSARD
jgi:hypothetical protein